MKLAKKKQTLFDKVLLDVRTIKLNFMFCFYFQLQVAALSALKTEVLELSARLQNCERERDSIQKKFEDEKERSHRRLEAVSSAHESRITEMHCVIAELSKKLKNQQESAIIEERETEGSGTNIVVKFHFRCFLF